MIEGQSKTLIAILLLASAYFIFFQKESWIGFYYPNEYDLVTYTQSSKLESLEECRSWVNSRVSIYNPSGTGYDYECGKNCKAPDHSGGQYVCEETIH